MIRAAFTNKPMKDAMGKIPRYFMGFSFLKTNKRIPTMKKIRKFEI
jgi:hypothetical protein